MTEERKFKVGDKVIFTDSTVGKYKDLLGKKGVITDITVSRGIPYDVCFEGWSLGHGGNRRENGANHWYCTEEALKLAEADEDTQPSVNYRELTAPTSSEVKAVSSNPHYDTSIQPIETMQANMTPEEFLGYLKGNIIKYACRCGRKDEPLKEAKKIKEYAGWLVDALEGKKIDPRAN